MWQTSKELVGTVGVTLLVDCRAERDWLLTSLVSNIIVTDRTIWQRGLAVPHHIHHIWSC